MSAEDERGRNSSHPGEGDDAALDHAWHEASREQPPSSVDARILAAARASVGTGRTADTGSTRWWTRWQPMLAAAAVAGLAFVLVPMTSAPPPAERATESTAPAAAQSPGTASVESAPSAALPAAGAVEDTRPLLREPAASQKSADRAGAASGRDSAARTEAGVARPPAAAPPPPAAAQSVIDDAAPADAGAESSASEASSESGSFGELGASAPRPSMESGMSAERTQGSATAVAPTAQAREKRADQAASAADTGAWVERIATAYRNGDLATATAQLRAFRAVEPAADDRLPDDVRNWARTVE